METRTGGFQPGTPPEPACRTDPRFTDTPGSIPRSPRAVSTVFTRSPVPPRPRPSVVAARAFVLAACSCRASLEQAPRDPGAKALFTTMLDWVDGMKLWPSFDPSERALVKTPLGRLARHDVMNASWRAEGLSVLAWALGHRRLPPYDRLSDGPAVAATIAFLEPEASDLVRNAELRPVRELRWYASVAESVLWRLRHGSRAHAAYDMRRHVASPPNADAAPGRLRLRGHDLSIGGVAMSKVDASTRRECHSIAMERLIAARWLLGDASRYARVGTDT